MDAARTAAREREVPYFQAEEESLTHFTLGALLAQRWNFPSDLRNAILYHHEPLSAEPFTKMAAIVHLSDVMAHLMGFRTFPEEMPPPLDEDAVSRIELQPERLRVIANTAVEDEERLESLVEFVS
ncbi:MAG: HDOD domain-containing protein [Chitinivibrionales bacterium]|nr:HDOD domain-containing protein [Chitinivibrionales bacterium]MBD3396645.1 HDOD domain-containing protein [Chitinivibrionales bacterium]